MLFWLAIICVTQNGKQENLLIAFRRLNGVRLLVGECRYGLSLTEVPIRRVRTDTLLVKWYRVGKFRFDKIIPFGVCCFHLFRDFSLFLRFWGPGKLAVAIKIPCVIVLLKKTGILSLNLRFSTER